MAVHKRVRVGERLKALPLLRAGLLDCIITTDLLARGLDVRNVALVVEYDLAGNAVDYLHRAGRTARAGARGSMVSFVGPDDGALAEMLQECNAGDPLDKMFSRNRLLRRKLRKQQKAAEAGANKAMAKRTKKRRREANTQPAGSTLSSVS
jgi:superfamily II DNA/RNA helicase